MKTRVGLSIGAMLLTVFGAAAASEPVIDEIVVTAKVAHGSPAPSAELVAEWKDVLTVAPVIELPKIQIDTPKLEPEHG
ncbi:MAG TPA: hypothetical protein VFO94_13605 [Gammaproteobacteria bacterium]|nr:hypothetical protein [Gammaproteobacteria bacterium]